MIGMNAIISLRDRFSKNFLEDSLFKNSSLLVLNKFLMVSSGFIFWAIAARLYPIEHVGIAVGLFSSASLIVSLSMFGFDISLLRFLPVYNKKKVLGTCILIISAASVIMAVIYILGLGIFSPKLSFLQSPLYGLIFILLTLLLATSTISSNAFAALRKAEYSLYLNIIAISRLIFLLPLIFLGSMGIISSIIIAYMIVYLFVFYILEKKIRMELKVDRIFLKESIGFSLKNYIAYTLDSAPYFIMPLIVLNLLGDAEAAKFYIGCTIGFFFIQIPDIVGISLLVEGSHGESLGKNIVKAAGAIYSILIPGIVIIFLFGSEILSIFGKNYTDSFELLKLLSAGSLFYAIYAIYLPVQNIMMNVDRIIKLNILSFCIMIPLSYLLLERAGIAGFGYAFIITFLILDIGIVLYENMGRIGKFFKVNDPGGVI
jgi:O-antigen/teichoic acid export membrane protein